MMYEERVIYLFILGIMLLLLVHSYGVLNFTEDEEFFVPITNFEYLHDAVDSMEQVQSYVDNLSESLHVANSRIVELEETDWVTRFELVKGELQKERDSHPNIVLFAYTGGWFGVIIGVVIAFLVHRNKIQKLKDDKAALQVEVQELKQNQTVNGGKEECR